MKVVINDGIGGFGISAIALKTLLDMGYPHFRTLEVDPEEYDEVKGRTVDLGNGYEKAPPYALICSTDELIKDGLVYHHEDRSLKARSSPMLVQIVENLAANANGEHAKLKIIEIPDGIEWELHESEEGYEWIAEKHRTWS